MKTITKLALLGAITAAFGATVALGDDPQLQERLSVQRAQDSKASRVSTIAVYSNRNGVGRATRDNRSEVRLESRTNANGQTFNVYVAAE